MKLSFLFWSSFTIKMGIFLTPYEQEKQLGR
jgi:hypothetical protein